jgi:flagellar protein FliS
MIQPQQNRYLEASMQTATPAQLLVMLHDGAIRFCKIAIEAIHAKNYELANHNLCKVQDIISEFVITLDLKAPIAESLLKLYDYFNYLLMEANVKKQAEPVTEVMGHLAELRSTWVEASKLATITNSVKNG